MTQDKLDILYLQQAYRVAAARSTDPSTQNGAVLVDFREYENGLIVARGANHFPDGVAETPVRWERPLKYSFVEHAERNAIYDAAYHGVRTEGLTMYCPWFACDSCARAIIQAGIAEVVGHVVPNDDAQKRFQDSIDVAMAMLREAGVKTRWVDAKIFSPRSQLAVRRDGKVFYP